MTIYIYKLCCKNPDIKEIYIGFTSRPLYKAFYDHKQIYNNPKHKKYNDTLYKFIRNNGTINNWDIVEVERYDKDLSIQEKNKYKNMWIENLHATLHIYNYDCEEQKKKNEKTEINKKSRKEYMKEYQNQLILCESCGEHIKRNYKYKHNKICKGNK